MVIFVVGLVDDLLDGKPLSFFYSDLVPYIVVTRSLDKLAV